MQSSLAAISILDNDEFVIGYVILYFITIVKMVFVKYSPIDLLILLFGVYVFYRRYLMVFRIDRMCSEISGPLKDAIENLIVKKTT
jgi:hypothetical protein